MCKSRGTVFCVVCIDILDKQKKTAFEKNRKARQRNNLKSCQILITMRKKNYSRDAKYGYQVQYEHFKANEWINATHEEDELFAYYGKISERRIVPKFAARHRTDRRTYVNIWTRSWQLISHTQLRGKSVSDMRTIIFSTSVIKDRNLDQWRKGQITHTQYTNFWLWENKWGIQIRISLNIYDSDSDQLKNVKDWNSNGNVGDGTEGLNLLLPLHSDGRHKNDKDERRIYFSFAL